ncbi:hypothetical protein Drorol1_Dr00009575 [Drosera rotundifolia]
MSTSTETPITQGTSAHLPEASTLPIVKAITQEISTKLINTNFLVWKMQVLPVLRCHGLLGLVDGTLGRPIGAETDPSVIAWLRLDQMVLAWLASSLSDTILLQVIHCSSAREIWQTLEVLYGTLSRAHIQSVKRELHSLTKGTLSISAYVHNARALSRMLTLAGEPVFDPDLIYLFLAGLPSEFDSVVASIQLANPLPSIDTVAAILEDFELRLQAQQSHTISTVAFTVTIDSPKITLGPTTGHGNREPVSSSRRGAVSFTRGQGNPNRGRGRPCAAPVTGDASSVYCYRCGYPNHKANACEAPPSVVAAAQAFTALHLGNHTDSSWFPDTGASHHMTPDTSLAIVCPDCCQFFLMGIGLYVGFPAELMRMMRTLLHQDEEADSDGLEVLYRL